MATNRRVVKQTDHDWYRTPDWATRALLSKERFRRTILEPCCGTGEIDRVLRRAGYRTYSYDLIDRGYGDEIRDAFTERRRVSNIVTNPPYNLVNPLVAHWVPLVRDKLCLLLRIAFLEGARRFAQLFSHTGLRPARIWVFTERVSMYPGDSDRTTGGTTCFAWFVWERGHNGPTTIDWIEPGWKPATKRTIRKRGTVVRSSPRERAVPKPTPSTRCRTPTRVRRCTQRWTRSNS